MTIFQSADILLPREDALGRWAVIACDQFSSEPGYWEETEKLVGNAPSALRLILPEARLGQDNTEAADSIHRRMEKYLQSGLFREYKKTLMREKLQDRLFFQFWINRQQPDLRQED